MNPYSGEDFLGFFAQLFHRMGLFFTGSLSWNQLASDEIQCLVLCFLGISLAFLGSFLVLKQMTMLANALSHTILFGIIVSFLLVHSLFSVEHLEGSFTSIKVLWIAALFSGVLTVLLKQFLTEVLHLQEDASIGLVFTTLFALGVLLVTLYTKNVHLSSEAIMGNIDALHIDDLKIAISLALSSSAAVFVFFRGFYLSSFDPVFAKSLGWPVSALNYLLVILTAAASIASFRAVGVLLFLSFLVGPVLISLKYTYSVRKLIALSALVSILSSVFSVALSRHLITVYAAPISTAGLVVSTVFIVYIIVILHSFLKKKRSIAK